jgi:hypothetical protein
MKLPNRGKTCKRYHYKGFEVHIIRFGPRDYEYKLTAVTKTTQRIMSRKKHVHKRLRKVYWLANLKNKQNKYVIHDPSWNGSISLCMMYAETNVNEQCSPLWWRWA